MTDNVQPKAEILPPKSAASQAVDMAKLAWEAAAARLTAAHRTAIAVLNTPRPATLADILDDPAAAEALSTMRDAAAARMEQRILLLADALQRHALLSVVDAATTAEAIGRGAVATPKGE